MRFRLISLSTTTGWLDWQHGELWLSTEGLLRRRRGWAATVAGDGLDLQKMAGATLPSIDQEFSSADIEEISRSGGLWVAANQVKAGWLRAGIITGRAKLDLIDGRSVKLLWARSPLTFTLLKETLAEWVDGAVEVD